MKFSYFLFVLLMVGVASATMCCVDRSIAMGRTVVPFVQNGGFEDGPWSGTSTVESVLVHSGVYAANLSDGGVTSPSIYVRSGRNYTMSFWTRMLTGGIDDCSYVIYDEINEQYIVNPTGSGVEGTDYTQVTKSFVVPEGCYLLNLQVAGPGMGMYGYVDDVLIWETGKQIGRTLVD